MGEVSLLAGRTLWLGGEGSDLLMVKGTTRNHKVAIDEASEPRIVDRFCLWMNPFLPSSLQLLLLDLLPIKMPHPPQPLASIQQIYASRSRKDGVPADIEEDLRVVGCMLIQEVGILLEL